jgi:hypothetical protein
VTVSARSALAPEYTPQRVTPLTSLIAATNSLNRKRQNEATS